MAVAILRTLPEPWVSSVGRLSYIDIVVFSFIFDVGFCTQHFYSSKNSSCPWPTSVCLVWFVWSLFTCQLKLFLSYIDSRLVWWLKFFSYGLYLHAVYHLYLETLYLVTFPSGTRMRLFFCVSKPTSFCSVLYYLRNSDSAWMWPFTTYWTLNWVQQLELPVVFFP